MSNFSQYFPSTSGGGSGGTPLNGYTPFLVTGTGNPSGYDATTGLYTHPDGTFWLRTGFSIDISTFTGPDPNYPDANYGITKHYDYGLNSGGIYPGNAGEYQGFTPAQGWGMRGFSKIPGGDLRYQLLHNNTYKYSYESATHLGGWTSSGGLQTGSPVHIGNAMGHAKDATTFYAINGNVINVCNSNYQITSTITLSDSISHDWGNYLPEQDKFYCWSNAGSTITVYEYDNTGTATGNTITVTHPGSGGSTYLAIRPNLDLIAAYQVATQTTGDWVLYSLSGYVATQVIRKTVTYTASQSPPQGPHTSESIYAQNFYYEEHPSYNIMGWSYTGRAGNSTGPWKWRMGGNEEVTISTGDGIARTDTDTGQPLFIRIG